MAELEHSQTMAGNYAKGLITIGQLRSRNERMQQAVDMAEAAAGTNILCLITGESGTGKNLLAQAVHNLSDRRDRPLVVVNCSAIPDTLLESELFGHEKGAFTGADAKHGGKFAEAEGGTLVLDEIGDMSQQAQAKVLHAIEYKQFTPVGGTGTRRADVRIIAITNQDLNEMVEEGTFRKDLFFRLNEMVITLPPLRSRKEDIPDLLTRAIDECNAKFNKQVTGVDDLAMNFIMRHDWPGNVRELFGVVKRGVTLCQDRTVRFHDLGLNVKFPAESDTDPELGDDMSITTMERRHIEKVLRLVNYHKDKACKSLKISRPTLNRKIAAYHLEIPGKKS
jgi:transcriptional regulator with PAS, ATPase and Fis domain